MDTNQETGVSLDDLAELIDAPEAVEEDEREDLSAEAPEEEPADEQAEGSEEPTDDLVDAEYEGKAYKVPKELKEALLRQSDYTRKTQEVAETRKAIEERAQLLQAQEGLIAATFDKAAELKQLQAQLSRFEDVNWQELSDSDPVQAQKLLIARQQLERALGAKAQEFQPAQAQYQHLTAVQRQQVLQEQAQAPKARLPDFSPEMAQRIRDVTKTYGYTDQELANVTDARLVHLLHDAMKWRDLQAKRPEAMKRVAEAPRAVKPTSPVQRRTNQAAVERLKSKGRVEDLAALL